MYPLLLEEEQFLVLLRLGIITMMVMVEMIMMLLQKQLMAFSRRAVTSAEEIHKTLRIKLTILMCFQIKTFLKRNHFVDYICYLFYLKNIAQQSFMFRCGLTHALAINQH